MPSPSFWLYLPVIITGALFFYSFLREPRHLYNGMLFNLFALTALATAAVAILSSQNRLLIAVSATLFIIFVLVVALLFSLHLVWLLWNAWLVWRREGHSLGNMLTLALAVGLILLEVAAVVGRSWVPSWLYAGLSVFFTLGIGYELIALYNFLTILVLYNLYRPRHDRDYLIVLGAGLLHGDQVSPLLAARIQVAITFYHKQVRLGRPAPHIIFSGGQGGDEKLPEGRAMQQWAIAHGIPEDATLVEDQSKTTYQNMKFSKALITKREGPRPVKAAFFTNNYHLFRAGVFARAAGLDANGVGAATSFYFLPNAVIREYLAFVVIHKRRHIVAGGLITLLAIVVAIGQAVS
ncbi:YdcF family protein [Lacticaseibacillus jixianensis]|uniref:YdcF family protein n=1 Tax=Lacticaseibacillus jixianensis TaxID=2486012 RepID=A0ABW4BAM4_9LACO|nr:YdcF family protein [Lacticaseibacillus jixianensis]